MKAAIIAALLAGLSILFSGGNGPTPAAAMPMYGGNLYAPPAQICGFVCIVGRHETRALADLI